jgi:hypothetical protein
MEVLLRQRMKLWTYLWVAAVGTCAGGRDGSLVADYNYSDLGF